jgi:hypothetical protein
MKSKGIAMEQIAPFTTPDIRITSAERRRHHIPSTVEAIKIDRSDAFIGGPGLQLITNPRVSDSSERAFRGYQRNWLIYGSRGTETRFSGSPPEIRLSAALQIALQYARSHGRSDLARSLELSMQLVPRSV